MVESDLQCTFMHYKCINVHYRVFTGNLFLLINRVKYTFMARSRSLSQGNCYSILNHGRVVKYTLAPKSVGGYSNLNRKERRQILESECLLSHVSISFRKSSLTVGTRTFRSQRTWPGVGGRPRKEGQARPQAILGDPCSSLCCLGCETLLLNVTGNDVLPLPIVFLQGAGYPDFCEP